MGIADGWLRSLDAEDLRAVAVLLAAVIAARETAEGLGITATAEVIADEGALSLVITPEVRP